jgi:inorganic pyrophosphatase
MQLNEEDFWRGLDQLVATCELILDRPKGSAHPRFPAFRYPFDYGFLHGTRSRDGGGLDVWVGGLPGRPVTGIICSVDTAQRDVEIKLLLGCTHQEARIILETHNRGAQAAILVERPARNSPEQD